MILDKSIINNSEFKFILNDKYCVFTIKDFLNEKFYNDIEKSFPKFEEYMNEKIHLGEKLVSIPEDDYIFKNFLASSEIHKKLYDYFHSKNFFNFIKKKLYTKFFLSQSSLLKKIKYIRPYKLIDENYTKKFYDIFFSKIKITIKYLYMLSDAYVGPHSDSLRKLCSLIIYFPEKNNSEDKDAGTQFWDSKLRNSSNTRIGEKDLNIFLEKSKKVIKEPFEKNRLVGFIRNDYSWHSVEKLNLPKDYFRKVIIINFLYVN